MRLKSLSLTDYRCYPKLELSFGDFTCLIGPNGIGKTTILDAISLVSSSLDFSQEQAEVSPGGWVPTVTGEQRLKAFLRKNIRNIDEVDACKGFEVKALFEHNKKEYEVILNENGFQKNEILKKKWWWSGITYVANFDIKTSTFQLREELWPKFKKAYEVITGFIVEPEDTYSMGKYNLITGFFMNKPGLGRISYRRGSSGEIKLSKALSQIISMEEKRQPHIIICDEIEAHIHHSRHLMMVKELKDLFKGKQLIVTTHSLAIIQSYQPQEDIVDIEKIIS